jgi:hypothetical protein
LGGLSEMLVVVALVHIVVLLWLLIGCDQRGLLSQAA